MGIGKKKFDFIFFDCCSFLGLGLGMKRNFRLSKYASIALIDTDDDEGKTFLEDVSVGGGSSSLFGDVITLDLASDETKANSSYNHEIANTEEDKKTLYSTPTISTLSMGHCMEVGKVLESNGEEEEIPSELVFPGNLVFEDRTAMDEDESITLNTHSTCRMRSRLDRNTLKPTSSLDSKTWHATLSGLQLLEPMIGSTEERDKRKKFRNNSHSCPQNRYQIERVPSMIDTFDADDQSLLSCIAADDQSLLSRMAAEDDSSDERIDKDRAGAVKGRSIKKRLFGGSKKYERALLWTRARLQKKTSGRELWVLKTQTSKSIPSPESFRSTHHVIESIKSIERTTVSIDTTEDAGYYSYYGENVPFDEPIICF